MSTPLFVMALAIGFGVPAATASAQDTLTIGTGSASAGADAQVPVWLRDVSATPLGTDAASGNRIQGIAFKVTLNPSNVVAGVAFARAGVLAPLTPMYESIVPSPGAIAYVGLFSGTTNAIPLTLDAAAPGDRIGTLTVTFDSSAPVGTVVILTFDSATAMLSNQAGSTGENAAGGQLSLAGGTATLSAAVTSTVLQSSSNPSTAGQTVSFTATVSSGTAGTISGTVEFRDNGALIGSVPLSGSQATFATSSLAAGTHPINAIYTGNGTFLPSTSGTVSQVVNAAVFGAPTGVMATATSATAVNVSWYPVSGADHYEVWRSFNNQAFASIGTTSSPAFLDMGLTAATTYLYEVRAVNGTGTPSSFSAIDAATTILFMDDPLVSQSTAIKAVHLGELRSAVNAFRAAAGLAPYSFTDSASPDVIIRATHVLELRTALNAALSALSMPAVAYGDSTMLAGSTFVKTIHFQQIREAVK